MYPDRKVERIAKREEQSSPPSTFVEANAYGRSKGAPVGAMISEAADAYYEAQAARLDGRKFSDISFENVDFSLLTPDQLDALVAATIIVSYHPVDAARELEYHRPDHELTTVDVVKDYYRLREYGTLRTYLEAYWQASGQTDQRQFYEQLDILREHKGEEIKIPLVEYLSLAAMQRLDLQVFFTNFALNVREPVLRRLLGGYALDQKNIGVFLMGRIKTELASDPTRLPEVEAGLLDFKPYGHVFDPGFEVHRAAMLKVSPPGLVRADLVRKAFEQLVGGNTLNYHFFDFLGTSGDSDKSTNL